jgi:hypothetical protein
MVDLRGPEKVERYKIKIIKKYNIGQELIMPRFRTRPELGLSGVVIGKNVSYETAREYVEHYLAMSGYKDMNIQIRLLK